MIKISAHVTRKLPVPGVDYSSQAYGAGLEVEVADTADAAEIDERIRAVYATLEQAIEAEIRQQTPALAHDTGRTTMRSLPPRTSGGNGRTTPPRQATSAQVKAIFAISRAVGQERRDLLEWLNHDYGAAKPEALTVVQASEVIEALKARQAG